METLNNTYTLYTTSTCTRCPLARRTMDRVGVEYREVVLDEPGNEMLVESMKEEMGTSTLSVPIILTPDNEILSNLAYISDHFRGMTRAEV